MNTTDQFIEKTKHIRTIHFTLILFSFSIAYLLYIGWSKRGNIATEINNLTGIVGLTERSRENMDALIPLQPDFFAELESDLAASISRQIERKIITPSDESLNIPIHINPDEFQAPSLKQRLKYIRQAIEHSKWRVTYPVDIKIDRALIDNWLPNYPIIPDVNSVRLVGITINDIAANSKSTAGQISLEAPDRSNVARLKSTGGLGSMYKSFPVLFHLQTHELSFEDNFFQKHYPSIDARFEELKNYRISEILADLNPQEKLYANTPEIDFLGLKFAAKDIGFLSPVILIVILSYLAAHVEKLHQFLALASTAENDPTIEVSLATTWIGLMDGKIPQALSLATIALAPCSIIFIAIEFFTEAPRFLAYIATTLAAIVSFRTLSAASGCKSKQLRLEKKG